MINPYTEWLGLPPETSRPDYFELLQLPPDQATPASVAAAVDAAIVRVRGYRPGPYAKQWAALIDELKQAKRTLVSPRAIERYRQQLEGEASRAWRGVPKTPKPDPQVKAPKRVPQANTRRDEFDPMAPVPVPLEDFLKAATPPTRIAAPEAPRDSTAGNSSSPAPAAEAATGSSNLSGLKVQTGSREDGDSPAWQDPDHRPSISSIPVTSPLSTGEIGSASSAPDHAVRPARRTVSDQPVFVNSVDHPIRRKSGFPWAVVACVTVLVLLAGLLVVQVSGLFNKTQLDDAMSQNSKGTLGDGSGGSPKAASRGLMNGVPSSTAELSSSSNTSKRPWANSGAGSGEQTADRTDESGTSNEALRGPRPNSATEAEGPDEPETRPSPANATPAENPSAAPPAAANEMPADSLSTDSEPLIPRAETIRFGDYLMAARQSLHDRDLDAAREQLVEMDDMPARSGDRAMRLRLMSLLGLVEQFWAAVERGAGTLRSAQELTFDAEGNIKIIIVEVNPGPVITYRVGERRQEPMFELPTEVAMLIAQQVLDEDDPDALRMRGAFYAIESLAKPDLETKALDLWQQAEQKGAAVGDLRLYLEDDYNLVNTLIERSPIPDFGELRKAEINLRADWAERRQGVNTADERAALARAFARAAPRDDSPVNRYFLFREALDWAGRSGQPDLALEIANQTTQWFEVENPLFLEADVMQEVAKSDGGEAAAREAATKVIELADRIVADETSLAESKDRLEQLFQAALTASKRTRDRDFQIEIRRAINEVRDKYEPAGVLR